VKFEIKEIANQLDENSFSLVHSGAWNEIYDSSSKTLGIYNKGGNLIGVFTLFFGRKLKQTYIITPPYCSDIGLEYECTASNPAQRNGFHKSIGKAISSYLDSLSFIFIDITLPYSIKDAQPYIWSKFETSIKYTYLLDLKKSEEEMLSEMSSERRKNIKSAQKKGFTTELFFDSDLISKWSIETLANNNAHYNSDIINNIIRNFATTENTICTVVKKDAEIYAMSFVVYDKKAAYYLFGWNNKDLKNDGSGALGLWSSILEAKNRGCALFNFEGSSIASIEKYFRGFGGALTPMINLRKESKLGSAMLRLKK